MTNRMRTAALVAGATALLPAAAAHAATKTVTMGEPANTVKTFENKYGSDVNDFFPHGVTIHVGDSIKWMATGFHTVDLPKKGTGPAALVAATGQKVTGVNDAAGAPFWFNGQNVLSFNPLLGASLFGKKATYNGSKRVGSGAFTGTGNPPPFTVKFTKAGNFTYYCNIHHGMKGIVHVVPKGKPVPSRKTDAAAVKKMVARDLKAAKAASKATVPAGTVDVGNSAPNGVSVYAFLPRTMTVSVGTTLTFRMTAGQTETHTATTGPGNPQSQPTSYLGQIAASFDGPGPFDARGVYASDPVGTPASLTPTYHGNGFWNSGALDASTATPFGSSNSVKFTAPGTYEFFCMIHPFMHGTVIVK